MADIIPFPRRLKVFDPNLTTTIGNAHLIFHFRVAIVSELRDLLSQLRRKAIRLDAAFGSLAPIFGVKSSD
jgi:hypothetical protein